MHSSEFYQNKGRGKGSHFRTTSLPLLSTSQPQGFAFNIKLPLRLQSRVVGIHLPRQAMKLVLMVVKMKKTRMIIGMTSLIRMIMLAMTMLMMTMTTTTMTMTMKTMMMMTMMLVMLMLLMMMMMTMLVMTTMMMTVVMMRVMMVMMVMMIAKMMVMMMVMMVIMTTMAQKRIIHQHDLFLLLHHHESHWHQNQIQTREHHNHSLFRITALLSATRATINKPRKQGSMVTTTLLMLACEWSAQSHDIDSMPRRSRHNSTTQGASNGERHPNSE